jgi:hypothetical protein
MQSTIKRVIPPRSLLSLRARPAPSQYIARPFLARTLVSTCNEIDQTVANFHFFCPVTAKKYTPEHEAVIFDDQTGVGTVSITNYAQESLGDVVFVELPAVGTNVSQGGT